RFIHHMVIREDKPIRSNDEAGAFTAAGWRGKFPVIGHGGSLLGNVRCAFPRWKRRRSGRDAQFVQLILDGLFRRLGRLNAPHAGGNPLEDLYEAFVDLPEQAQSRSRRLPLGSVLLRSALFWQESETGSSEDCRWGTKHWE